MKVNFNEEFRNVDGKPIQGSPTELLSTLVSNGLVQQRTQDSIVQTYELAQKITTSKGEIEISESERQLLRKFAESGQAPVLIAAQILIKTNK